MKRLLLFTVLTLSAFASESLFQRGNEAYQSQDYEKALEFYSQIESSEIESAALYFNMGNSYFKLNRIGKAIQYFEKAKKLAPLDQDILANLTLVNEKIVDRIEFPDQLWIFDMYNRLKYAFSINGLLLISLSLFGLVFIGVLAKRFIHNLESVGSILSLIGTIGFLFFLTLTLTRISDLDQGEAVVIENQTTIYTSPEAENEAFILHEGAKFKMIRELNAWVEISLIDGKTGWVSYASIGKI